MMHYQNHIGNWLAGHSHMDFIYDVTDVWGMRTLCRGIETPALYDSAENLTIFNVYDPKE